MPMRKYPKRRNYRKKRAGFRSKKRSGVRRLNTTNQGYVNINRRLPFIAAQATNVVGGMGVVDPTMTCLALGTPTAIPGGLSGLYDIPFSMGFRLDQLVNYTEFTALFDHYRINSVKVDLKTFFNTSTFNGISMPWLEHWTDHDDATPLTSAQAREVMGTKTKYYTANSIVKSIYVKPRPLVQLAAGDGTPAPGALMTHNWINCTDIDIPHYGIKGILHNVYLGGTPGTAQFQYDVKVNMSFKGVQ